MLISNVFVISLVRTNLCIVKSFNEVNIEIKND